MLINFVTVLLPLYMELRSFDLSTTIIVFAYAMEHFHIYLVLLDINFLSLLVAFSEYFHMLFHSYPIHLLVSYYGNVPCAYSSVYFNCSKDGVMHHNYSHFYAFMFTKPDISKFLNVSILMMILLLAHT